jgi:hypothetical protein
LEETRRPEEKSTILGRFTGGCNRNQIELEIGYVSLMQLGLHFHLRPIDHKLTDLQHGIAALRLYASTGTGEIIDQPDVKPLLRREPVDHDIQTAVK